MLNLWLTLRPQAPIWPLTLRSPVGGAVTSSAVRWAVPVRWDEAGDNVSHVGPSLPEHILPCGGRGKPHLLHVRSHNHLHPRLPPPGPPQLKRLGELLLPAPIHPQGTRHLPSGGGQGVLNWEWGLVMLHRSRRSSRSWKASLSPAAPNPVGKTHLWHRVRLLGFESLFCSARGGPPAGVLAPEVPFSLHVGLDY